MRRRSVIAAAEGVVSGRRKPAPKVTAMVSDVFSRALKASGIAAHEIEGFVGIPALAELRFLEGHYLATKLGLFDDGGPVTRTVDTCGASPVTALLEADRMIRYEGLDVVAVASGDVVGSMSSKEFLAKAETTSGDRGVLESPAIVHGYDKVMRYQCENFDLTRTQARMVVALESFHASQQPDSLFAKWRRGRGGPYTLAELEAADAVTDLISVKECAWRADGAACLIVASEDFVQKRRRQENVVVIAGGGEGSGPLYPQADIKEAHFGTKRAMDDAYSRAGLKVQDMDFFGLYDCFPICLLRAIEAAGIADDAGAYVEAQYNRMLHGDTDAPDFFPINTHGGLLCYGAPFAVPAHYNIIEAVRQLQGNPIGRKIPSRNALVYGNGGVFSSSAVAILSKL